MRYAIGDLFVKLKKKKAVNKVGYIERVDKHTKLYYVQWYTPGKIYPRPFFYEEKDIARCLQENKWLHKPVKKITK